MPSSPVTWEWGCTWVSHPGEKQTWLSQPRHLTHMALLLPGLQLPPAWRGNRDSSGISLPQRWMSLFTLTVSCACQLSYQDVQTLQGTTLLWSFWDYPRRCYPGRALGRWELSARHKVWMFAVFVPICQVLAAKGFVLCRLLKRIQSHSNYYCSREMET